MKKVFLCILACFLSISVARAYDLVMLKKGEIYKAHELEEAVCLGKVSLLNDVLIKGEGVLVISKPVILSDVIFEKINCFVEEGGAFFVKGTGLVVDGGCLTYYSCKESSIGFRSQITFKNGAMFDYQSRIGVGWFLEARHRGCLFEYCKINLEGCAQVKFYNRTNVRIYKRHHIFREDLSFPEKFESGLGVNPRVNYRDLFFRVFCYSTN